MASKKELAEDTIKKFVDWARDYGEDAFYIFDYTEEAIELFIDQMED